MLSRNQETSFFLELCQKTVLLNGEIKHLPVREAMLLALSVPESEL